MRDQSPWASASAGTNHEPPTQATLGKFSRSLASFGVTLLQAGNAFQVLHSKENQVGGSFVTFASYVLSLNKTSAIEIAANTFTRHG